MNNNLFSVMQSPRGTLTLTNQNSALYWELQQSEYEEITTGTKKQCEQYIEEWAVEHWAINE